MTPPAVDNHAPVAKIPRRSGAGALFVSIGIFATKLFGIVRQVVIAHYLGASVAADAFNAAFRIPNLLQNRFGEGARALRARNAHSPQSNSPETLSVRADIRC